MGGFICVDPSLSCTGFFVAGSTFSYSFSVKRQKGERYSTLAALYSVTNVTCTSREIVLAVIERYAFAAKGNAITKVAEVGGAIRAACASAKVKIYEISSQSWKLIALGDGHIKKPQIRSAAESLYDEVKRLKTQDEIDAFLMGVVVRAAFTDKVFAEENRNKSLQKIKSEIQGVLNEEEEERVRVASVRCNII